MKKILIVVGARPNFVKVACFKKAAKELNVNLAIEIVHTGQHYDDKLSTIFFEQLEFFPDHFLNIEPSSANIQIANIMIKLEELISKTKPDLIIVVGDVNSTLAAALTANKLGIKLAHVESGLRSWDKTMPEEINRILADKISNFHFVTEQSGIDNLEAEGHKLNESVYFVGNTMIDTLVRFEKQIEQSQILDKFNISSKKYVLFTMHRPSNVDNEDGLKKLIHLMNEISKEFAVVFPIHPRTLNNLEKFNLKHLLDANKGIKLAEPLDYFSFQKLIKESYCVITDSGGVQEETSFQQIPCITLRQTTERPVTLIHGSNELLPFEITTITDVVFNSKFKKGNSIPLWDGKASHRILQRLITYLLPKEELVLNT